MASGGLRHIPLRELGHSCRPPQVAFLGPRAPRLSPSHSCLNPRKVPARRSPPSPPPPPRASRQPRCPPGTTTLHPAIAAACSRQPPHVPLKAKRGTEKGRSLHSTSITSRAHPMLPITGSAVPHRHSWGLCHIRQCQIRSRPGWSHRQQKLTARLLLSLAATPPMLISSH